MRTDAMGYDIPKDHAGPLPRDAKLSNTENFSSGIDHAPLPGAELNPQHPITRALHNQWHVIAAILINKYGTALDATVSNKSIPREVVITVKDLLAMRADPAVAIFERDGNLHFQLISGDDARELAGKRGS